jgi:O-antigen/teichoic acid export membrane protein
LLSDLKNTIRQSAIYGLSRVSTKIIAFVLLPFLTLHLSVSQYGIYVLTESFWQILWSIYLFGLESGIVRWYFNIYDEVKRKRFIFSVFIFVLFINVVSTALVYFFGGPLSKLVYDDFAFSNLILIASLIATAETFLFIVFLLLRIEEKAKSYSLYAIVNSILSLVLQLYFLLYTENKLAGLFIAKAIAPAFLVILMVPYLVKKIKIGIEKSLLSELFKYSAPVMAASLVITLLNQVDRNILGYLTNLNDVGIFGLANNISGLINFLVISPFSLAFTVLSWKKLKDENAKRFYTKNITYLFFSVTFISLGIALFTPHLIKVITLKTDYWITARYVPWVIIAMPFYGIHFIGVFSFYVSKKTHLILYSYLIALIVKIALDFVLIPQFEIYGASFANFISFFILVAAIYIFSKSNYFFSYEWYKIILMIILYFACTIPFFAFDINSRILELILKFSVVIIFPFLFYPFKFYEEIELQRIKGFFNKYILRISNN